jgi:hypothetical protein
VCVVQKNHAPEAGVHNPWAGLNVGTSHTHTKDVVRDGYSTSHYHWSVVCCLPSPTLHAY